MSSGGPASACVRELCTGTRPPFRLLQMVRTLAHFSISLEDMNEHGENAGNEGGEKDGGGEDPVDPLRNKKDGNNRVNLDGNGLGAGSPNGEVQLVFSGLCISVHPPNWTQSSVLTSLCTLDTVQLIHGPILKILIIILIKVNHTMSSRSSVESLSRCFQDVSAASEMLPILSFTCCCVREK